MVSNIEDAIRDLRVAGLSERRIAAELGVTRHRVRTALAGFTITAPRQGETWVETVGLALEGAKYRPHDEEQLPAAELAYDIAQFLDAHDADGNDGRQLMVNLRQVIGGVREGINPLTRIHARRAQALMATLDGRDWNAFYEPRDAEGNAPPAPRIGQA